ncbi:lipoprotein [Streptomyces olivochromogenes]|uniref:Lipoprotein n=1 Tax=Streptomyces olivochromogenes TaxID=1963 RepID=A0A250VQC7_STROL|nr:lipoprotein [Streptomyces olivochromogenes]
MRRRVLRRPVLRRPVLRRPVLRRPLGKPALGSPLQILLLACSFALAGYAGVRLLAGDWFGVALWFVGAAVLHDLVLVPLYAGADRAVARGLGAVGRREWTVYVRFPAAFSALLLLMWFPLISGQMAEHYRLASGLSGDGFLARWLLITAVLFGGSAALLVLRLFRSSRSSRSSRSARS